MSTQQKGAITNPSLREVLLKERKTLNKKIIAYGATTAISLGGMGLLGYESTGVEARLAKELYRPDQTVLSEAQQTHKTFDDQNDLFKHCLDVYSPNSAKCSGLFPEFPKAPKMSLSTSADVLFQEEAFASEAEERRSAWAIFTLPLTVPAGIGLAGLVFYLARRRVNTDELQQYKAKESTVA